MLDIKFILENKDKVKWASEVKSIPCDVDKICNLYEEIKSIKVKHEDALALKNKYSKAIPTASNEERPDMIAKSKEAGAEAKKYAEDIEKLQPEFDDLMLRTPQIPIEEAPIGGEEANKVIKTVGEPTKFDFEPIGHYDLLEKNDWAEFNRLTKITGPRTYATKGSCARLELAIQTFVIDKLIEKGFNYITVPALVKPEAIMDAGHFPGSDIKTIEDDVFHLEGTGKCLAGTAEIILNSLHKDEILKEDELPIMYAGYSPCYRKEAGAAGKDTRGLIRVHQFHKVEQFIICKNSAEESAKMHELLRNTLEEVMNDLELPYQVLETATGDMGINKIRMQDVEAWMPSEGKYRELGSCSTIHDYQARRTNTRYRENGSNEVKFCHTLNNTGIALPRALAPVLENHQTADGRVRIPVKLRPYMGGKEFLD